MQYNVVKNTVHDELVKNFNVIQTTDTSDLVKRVAYYKKIKKLKRKYLTMINILLTGEINKLVKERFADRLKQANLASKNDMADFVKKTDYIEKLIKKQL